MDSGSRSSLQTDEETHRGSPNADRTKGKGRANHVTYRGQGTIKFSLNGPKGGQANAVVYPVYDGLPEPGQILSNPGMVNSICRSEQMGVKNLQANVDSRLVANHVNGSYVAKESGMVHYLEKVKTLTSNFKEFSIKQVPRRENKKANALSKIASISFAHLSKQVLVEELNEKSINEKEVLAIVEEEGHT
ncbi:reverse transcriptase domain-containing protein [Tanacetum coccineum]